MILPVEAITIADKLLLQDMECLSKNVAKLTNWERDFLQSIQTARTRADISQKQWNALQGIVQNIQNADIRAEIARSQVQISKQKGQHHV